MKRHHRKPYSSAFVLWLLFVVAVVFVLVTSVQLAPLLIYLVAVNVATLLLFGWDKWQSGREGDRVPENILYAVTLAGGTVGALIGMHVFRHKTRKGSFQVVVALIMLVQIALVAWLMW